LICRKTSSTDWWEWLKHPPVPATWHNLMPRSILSRYFQGCVKDSHNCSRHQQDCTARKGWQKMDAQQE
jgi:hypothetical protein